MVSVLDMEENGRWCITYRTEKMGRHLYYSSFECKFSSKDIQWIVQQFTGK